MTKTATRIPGPRRANEAWFVEMGRIESDSRNVSVLFVIDLFSRECLAAKVQTTLNARDIVQVLSRLAPQRGRPEHLVLDRRRRFTEFEFWASSLGQRIEYVNRAQLTGNGAVEKLMHSLNINGADNVPSTVDAWNRSLKDQR